MGKNFSTTTEYAIFCYNDTKAIISKENRSDNPDVRDLMNTAKGASGNYLRETGKTCFYPVYVKDMKIIGFGDVCLDDFHPAQNESGADGIIEVYPIDGDGTERKWVLSRSTVESCIHEIRPKIDKKTGNIRIERSKSSINFKTAWTDGKYSAKKYGTELLGNIIPETRTMPPLYPKSLNLVTDCIYAGSGMAKEPLICDYFGGSGTTGHAVINLNREDNGRRKYILIEMGDHFDTVLKPRIAKVVYSPDWKDGKPVTRDKGVSHCFKYIRLESYEDTLNNLRFTADAERERALTANDSLRRDYTLNYLLDVETRGSQSLLNLDGFANPTAYTLKVKKPGAIGCEPRPVDLIETFNFLIGLRLVHLAAPQRFTATFERVSDPDLPEGTDTRLQLAGKMRQSPDGAWWFRKVEGWVPKDRENPNNGQKEKVLIVWRTLTGNLEEDNLMLDEWFQKNRLSTRDFEFDTIYVNGSNNLPNLKLASDTWKVRLLEEEFHKAMWDTQDS